MKRKTIIMAMAVLMILMVGLIAHGFGPGLPPKEPDDPTRDYWLLGEMLPRLLGSAAAGTNAFAAMDEEAKNFNYRKARVSFLNELMPVLLSNAAVRVDFLVVGSDQALVQGEADAAGGWRVIGFTGSGGQIVLAPVGCAGLMVTTSVDNIRGLVP